MVVSSGNLQPLVIYSSSTHHLLRPWRTPLEAGHVSRYQRRHVGAAFFMALSNVNTVTHTESQNMCERNGVLISSFTHEVGEEEENRLGLF
ncbi:hypothetical protein EJB05_00416, partial [Eragrostis curvula]